VTRAVTFLLTDIEGSTAAWEADATAKSFITLDWGASVATERKWQGRRVEKRRVLYVAAEGARPDNSADPRARFVAGPVNTWHGETWPVRVRVPGAPA
jgi:hypothetical protein